MVMFLKYALDAVVGDAHIAARSEAGLTGLLQDAEDPLGRKEDRVMAELRAVHAHEGRGAGAPFDRVMGDL